MSDVFDYLKAIADGKDIETIKPIPNVTTADMRTWAAQEWWSKEAAISRVISSRCEPLTIMEVAVKSLLARTVSADWKDCVATKDRTHTFGNGKQSFERTCTLVKATDWLMWCRGQGFTAAPALWEAMDGDPRFQKEAKAVVTEAEVANIEKHLNSLDPADPAYLEHRTLAKAALARLSKEKAALMGQSTGSKKRTEAQKRKAELREAVQERMQKQDSPNRMQALKDINYSGKLHGLGYYIGASIGGKKIKDPMQRAYKDTHGVTIKPCSTE